MSSLQETTTTAKRSPSKRHDDLTTAAQAIIDKERADREKKSERLRVLRLAKEQADALIPVPLKVKKATRKAI